ncbi:MAG: thioredoxin family protein [Bellilinea sp.]
MKPVVDGLEQEMGERLIVLRVDIHTQAGQEIASQYRFEYTPTFILFDEQGNEQWREVGGLDVDRVRQTVGGE